MPKGIHQKINPKKKYIDLKNLKKRFKGRHHLTKRIDITFYGYCE
jgi:hypothetical protein